MPNTNSAKKRLHQSLVRRTRNRAARSMLKTAVRKVREAVTAGDVTAAEPLFRQATKSLDRSAARGYIHANAAARTKSRLSAAIKRAKSAPPAAS